MPQVSQAKVLIIATDGFEESELFGPREILTARGAIDLGASQNDLLWIINGYTMALAALLVGALIASLLAPGRSLIAVVITLGPDC